MASYGTDLNVFDLADSAGNWSELSGHTSGASPAADTENYFHNSASVSQGTGQATGTNAGMECDYGSAITWTAGWVIMAWQYYTAPTNIETWANGGMRIGVGSTSGNMDYWNAMGSNFGDLPKGCWQNTAIDPSDPSGATYSWLAADGTADGSPTGAVRLFGSLPNVLAKISKGSPHACDVIRYGRGEIYATGTGGTFTGYASFNDVTSSLGRLGLFEVVRGGYLWKGLLSFGQSGTSLTFSDSSKTIFVDDCPRVRADFTKMQNLNASSNVTWTNINIVGIPTSITGSAPTNPGTFDFTVGTIDIDGGVFSDLGAWEFTGQTIDDATFARCMSIISGGSTFTNVIFNAANDTEAVIVADLDELDNCSFVMGASGHAVELTGAAGTYDWDCLLSGYDTGSAGNDIEVTGGSITGDEAIHVTATTGTVVINVSETATIPSVSSAGASVNVIAGTVTTAVTVKDSVSKAAIEGVAVTIKAATTGPLPFEDTVTITRTGDTATVSHTGHGLSTGQKVVIQGAVQNEYNRIKTITVTGDNAYTYSVLGSPTTPATGTIIATAVIIDGLTDASGQISDSRTLSSDQDITGKVQKGSTPPVYKPQDIATTVDSSNGVALSFLLTAD